MKKASWLFQGAALVALWLLCTESAVAQGKFRIGYGSTSANYAPLWVAKEAGIFEENGLNVELIFIPSGTLLTQALLSGDVDIGFPNGGQVIAAAAKGAELTIIGIGVTKMIFSLMVPPRIRGVSDLKGKRIGVTRFGSSTDVSARYALRKYGLDPEREVTILQMGSVPNILAGLQSGSLEAGVLSPPTHWRAEKIGFRELINITDLNIAYPNPAIAASKRTVKEKEDSVKKFARAYVLGMERARSDKAHAKRVLAKYTLIKDEDIIEKVYEFYVHKVLEPVPRISLEALRGAVEEQSRHNPRIRDMPLSAFYDDRFFQ